MTNDIYFKKIEIPNIDKIVEQSLEFIKKDSKVYNRELSSYYILDFKKFSNQCPLVISSLESIGLTPYLVSIFIMYKNDHGPIHIDLLPPYAKVLIPLMNTQGTKTHFYGNCNVIRVSNPVSGIKSYRPILSSDISLNATTEVIEPIVIRTSVPHSVEMNETNFPRITMQIETNPDPVKFLSELPISDDKFKLTFIG
jgi:hypothetical protein